MNTLQYKGFLGSVGFSEADGVFFVNKQDKYGRYAKQINNH